MTLALLQTSALRQREDLALPARLAVSAEAQHGVQLAADQVDSWLERRRQAHVFTVDRIPFAEFDGWRFVEDTGNLYHRSRRFFTVEGLRVSVSHGLYEEWCQPIIKQPEVGILGIIAKEFDGVLHFLMQAKMEPGNRNLLQLSPTVQATRSNYTRVHGGSVVRYLDYFCGARRGRVIADVLQSEHGAWFYHKRNRNMVVEVTEEVPRHEDFCWLTLGQINALLRRDNVINMDARTVLSCIPPAAPLGEPRDAFEAALIASTDPRAGALHATHELLSWITSQRIGQDFRTAPLPLDRMPGWHRTDDEIARDDGRFFRVIGVSVQAGSREVTRWTQPLFEPTGLGVAAFIVKPFGGVLHLLVHAKAECGLRDGIELAPTVQCVPSNHDAAHRPPLLDYVLDAPPARVRFEAVHSEEGGRFRHAESRYMVVLADDGLPTGLSEEYAWVTAGQFADLLRHGHYVNVQARTLITCLNSMR